MFASRKMCPTANVKSDRSMFCYTTTVELAMEYHVFGNQTESKIGELFNKFFGFSNPLCHLLWELSQWIGWFYKRIFKTFHIRKNSQFFLNYWCYYSEVPNRRADRNKRAGLKKSATLLLYLLSKSINEQGGIFSQPWSFIPVCSSIRDFRVVLEITLTKKVQCVLDFVKIILILLL